MKTKFEQNSWRITMVGAPLLVAVSQFFWEDGLLTPTAGWLQVLAFTCWIVAFKGMFDITRDKMPKYSAIGFLIAAYASVGGAGFGFDGIYISAMDLTSQADVTALHGEMGLPLQIALFIPGVFFPLSLLVLGIQLIRSKSVTIWVGLLLIIAAIGFPVSRIPRIEWIAHADNVLLILSHVLIAVKAKLPDAGR